MSTTEPILFIVDDDEAMLDALKTMAATIGISAQGYSSAQQFLDDYRPNQSGCLVIDVRMPGMSGLELQATLAERDIQLPVIVISGHADVRVAVRAVKAGALDFLEKPFKQQDLLDLINEAFRIDTAQRSARIAHHKDQSRYELLTPRERQVMALMVRGRAGKEIAAELGISYKTVEKFRARVMSKTRRESVAELVLMAVRLGLLSPAE